MKRLINYFAIFTLLFATMSCGGSDSGGSAGGDNGSGGVTTVAPSVVSTTPTNGATDISIGSVAITVNYDQTVSLVSTDKSKIQISGGTITAMAASGKSITLTANCPDYNATVNITIPKDLVVNANSQGASAHRFSFTTVAAPTPVNTDIATSPVVATTEPAKKLYSYFVEQYGQKVISSVMADVNWNHKIADNIKSATGKYPAMNCYDFIHIYVPENNWINYNDITPVKEWADAGGIVQLMWHFNVPVNASTTPGTNGSGVTCTPSETTFRAANVFTDGSWERKWFYQEMDKVIAVILKLQEAGIPATWRPFHEAAGNATRKEQASWTTSWFWWGYDGAEVCKKLWITMFDYFKSKGVKNLIWIWTTQNYNGDATQYNQDTDWYPGDKYVDIIGRDLYGYSAAQNEQEFREIQNRYPNKMVVLSECGNDSNNNKAYANISDCWNTGAKWGHFMVWYGANLCNNGWWNDALKNSNVITRDQVPSFK